MSLFSGNGIIIKEKSNHFDGERFFFPYKSLSHSLLNVLKWRLLGKRPKWPKEVSVITQKPQSRVTDHIRLAPIGHATVLIQANFLSYQALFNHSSQAFFLNVFLLHVLIFFANFFLFYAKKFLS